MKNIIIKNSWKFQWNVENSIIKQILEGFEVNEVKHDDVNNFYLKIFLYFSKAIMANLLRVVLKAKPIMEH